MASSSSIPSGFWQCNHFASSLRTSSQTKGSFILESRTKFSAPSNVNSLLQKSSSLSCIAQYGEQDHPRVCSPDLQNVNGQGKFSILTGSSKGVPSESVIGDLAMLSASENRVIHNMFADPLGSSFCEKDSAVLGNSCIAKRLQVAVDVDEVLGRFLSSLNIFIAERYSLQHSVSDYCVYDFRKIWKCSQAEANQRVHDFFKSEHFNNGIQPIAGAYESLLEASSFCDLVVVTSRQHVIRKPTLEWIERHFPGIFKEVHFGNHFALEGEARPKSEICRLLDVDILIDDNPLYAMECANHGIQVLLFDYERSYPWSKMPQGCSNSLITIVRDWKEVGRTLSAEYAAKLT